MDAYSQGAEDLGVRAFHGAIFSSGKNYYKFLQKQNVLSLLYAKSSVKGLTYIILFNLFDNSY